MSCKKENIGEKLNRFFLGGHKGVLSVDITENFKKLLKNRVNHSIFDVNDILLDNSNPFYFVKKKSYKIS